LAALQQRKITETVALAEINEIMDTELTTLTNENKRLQDQVQAMSTSITKLQTLQSTFDQISKLQEMSIDEIEQQVNESKLIVTNMEQTFQTGLLQNLITILLAVDKNNHDKESGILSDAEINDLIHQLENIHNIAFDEQKVRDLIVNQHQRNIKGVMDVVRKALLGDPNNPDSIFSFITDTDTDVPGIQQDDIGLVPSHSLEEAITTATTTTTTTIAAPSDSTKGPTIAGTSMVNTIESTAVTEGKISSSTSTSQS
jgi:hypothetical protein